MGLSKFGRQPNTIFSGTNSATGRAVNEGWKILGAVSLIEEEKGDSISLNNVYEFDVEVERFGYAYGAQIGTVSFARVILLVYLVVFVLYVIYALWDQMNAHKYTISSWGGLHDIVTLAMNSTPAKELENCGAGIERSRTWQERVKIRANDDDRLEMVFQERKDHIKLRPGVKYG